MLDFQAFGAFLVEKPFLNMLKWILHKHINRKEYLLAHADSTEDDDHSELN